MNVSGFCPERIVGGVLLIKDNEAETLFSIALILDRLVSRCRTIALKAYLIWFLSVDSKFFKRVFKIFITSFIVKKLLNVKQRNVQQNDGHFQWDFHWSEWNQEKFD